MPTNPHLTPSRPHHGEQARLDGCQAYLRALHDWEVAADDAGRDRADAALAELIGEGVVEGRGLYSVGLDYALTAAWRAGMRNCPADVP